MDAIWVRSLHNLHCPSCDNRLVQRAAQHFHRGVRGHVYVGVVGTLRCPDGHSLPGRAELYDYRAQRLGGSAAPVTEVASENGDDRAHADVRSLTIRRVPGDARGPWSGEAAPSSGHGREVAGPPGGVADP